MKLATRRSCTLHLALCTLTFAFLSVSCAPTKPAIDLSKLGPQEMMDLGLKQLNAKQYGKAIATFQQMTYDYASTRYAMEAQSYLAESYLRKKDYAQAQLEFEFLTTNFPSSPFSEEANYKTALCYLRAVPKAALDQSGLKKAQDLIDLFREQHPASRFAGELDAMEAEIAGRYAKKEYDAALLYARAGEYASAKVYLLHILETYPKASMLPDVKLQLAIAQDETGEKDKARQGYQELVSTSSDARIRKLAEDRLAKMKP
jgi:outer membrane assembly lipoprotein YfiO